MTSRRQMKSEGWPLWSPAWHQQRQVLAFGKNTYRTHTHTHRADQDLGLPCPYTFGLNTVESSSLFSRSVPRSPELYLWLQKAVTKARERRREENQVCLLKGKKGEGVQVPESLGKKDRTRLISENAKPNAVCPLLCWTLLFTCVHKLDPCLVT